MMVNNRVMTETEQGQYSVNNVLELVSDKWVVDVLHAIRDGDNRYGQMQRAIPDITKKMLTQTLRRMERNGILERVDYEENPPHVEYYITEVGESLITHLTRMCEWSKNYFASVEKARMTYDGQNNE
jgi:DNA-binding HxlR family transcriptional regulator